MDDNEHGYEKAQNTEEKITIKLFRWLQVL